MLVDSHCHLDRLKLDKFDGDLDAVLDLARSRGVGKFLCVGISLENADAVVEIASRYEDVVCSVGVHPLDVDSGMADVERLVEMANQPNVVALGETGLDYYYSTDTQEIQQQSFIAHLKAAGQAELPVIVHTRDAREDTIALIKEHGNTNTAGVLHCFTESWDMAKAALDLNYYISLSGIVTFKNAEELRDVARKLPLDRLLVETDSPYLAPVPYRGKPNIPAYVREVAEFIADLRGIPYEELAEITSENFFRLFPRAV
ncbi:TatD family hydrolase [Microbulbifer sp. PAAF003]|uniref:TatD family hydrolase n=1 Tax=unclassified Microbulbifer TaxID=2619833 RepID=UPI004039C52A